MTRDQWLEQCAERLRDQGDMEPGVAAYVAIELSEQQQADHGRNPHHWDNPGAAADEEIRLTGGE